MTQYYRVSPKFWRDARSWDDKQRVVALYLLTNEHRTTEGLYYLPVGYAETDIGYSKQTVSRTFEFLKGEGFMLYDPAAQVVLILKALKYQAPATEAQIKGALNRLEVVPSTPLRSDFIEVCSQYCPALASAIRVSLGWHESVTKAARR